MIIKALSATQNTFRILSGDFTFSEDQLNALATSAAGVPVVGDFDFSKPNLGEVISGQVIDGQLFIEAELLKPESLWDLFLVPCFRESSFESISYGITKTPSDGSLTTIQIIK